MQDCIYDAQLYTMREDDENSNILADTLTQ